MVSLPIARRLDVKNVIIVVYNVKGTLLLAYLALINYFSILKLMNASIFVIQTHLLVLIDLVKITVQVALKTA